VTAIAPAGSNFESTVGIGGEKLLKIIGILRAPGAIAEKHDSVGQVAVLP